MIITGHTIATVSGRGEVPYLMMEVVYILAA